MYTTQLIYRFEEKFCVKYGQTKCIQRPCPITGCSAVWHGAWSRRGMYNVKRRWQRHHRRKTQWMFPFPINIHDAGCAHRFSITPYAYSWHRVHGIVYERCDNSENVRQLNVIQYTTSWWGFIVFTLSAWHNTLFIVSSFPLLLCFECALRIMAAICVGSRSVVGLLK